jgi:phosphatidylinositol-3-phosphatase
VERRSRGILRFYLAVMAAAVLALIVIVVVVGMRQRTPAPTGSTSPTPQSSQSAQSLQLDHVFVIVEENKSYSQIVGSKDAPYINSLIKRYALATDYSALFHPSLPNYIALTSGSNHGITDDRGALGNEVAAANIADRIEAAGKAWKEYAESMPSPGYASDSGLYAVRHDPFMYYKDIAGNAQRARSHVVPFTELAADLRTAGTTPDFAFITPNLVNDMHDGPVSAGDKWLARQVPPILQSAAFTTTRSVLIVTWDEGTFLDNHVATILVGSSVRAGYRSATRYDHYALLHTIEAALGLPPLTANDAGAPWMSEFFN